jgi:8-oxo-dGTP diphosphatase
MNNKVESAFVIPIVKGADGIDKILLLQRSGCNSFPPGTLDLPGGTVYEGEDPVTTALREVREETNLQLSENEIQEVAAFMTKAGTLIKFYLYRGHGEHNVTISEEHLGHVWLSLEELSQVHHVEKSVVPVHGDMIFRYYDTSYEGREGTLLNGSYIEGVPLFSRRSQEIKIEKEFNGRK